MSTNANAPIIIKRKKVVSGDGHHGGAWKVAYADFVTAMMAFFMLMWLLGSVSEQKRSGIANYFAPTASVARSSGGGQGMFGGHSIFGDEYLINNPQTQETATSAQTAEKALNDQLSAEEAARVEALERFEEELLAKGGESALSDLALRHIVTRLTDEGLVIELFDVPDASLFIGASARPQAITVDILTVIARQMQNIENNVAINSHLAAQPLALRDAPTWALSLERSSQVRKVLEAGGLDGRRVQRLVGSSTRKPAVSDSLSERNNRIEIIMLR